MRLLQQPTRLLFFTGKGGVGKTSLACATAVALADQGKNVLLVSTDPASNLGQVFGVTIGEHDATAIPGVPGLSALNINPEAAAQAYRDRLVGPVRGVLPAETVKGMEEQLSGACTTEIAAFDEFTGLLADDVATGKYDHIIFDTAPTGHTLRLLQLPTAWSNYLDSNESGASCLGPLSGLEKQREQYAHAVAQLANGDSTTVVLVSRPQKASLAEADRTSHELATLGIVNQQLVINGIMPENGSDDPLAAAMREREKAAMLALPPSLVSLPRHQVPLRAKNMVGLAALRALLSEKSAALLVPQRGVISQTPLSLPPLSQLIDAIEKDQHGLVMVLGKGGVGKTTVAAAIAVDLASRGHAVHLTTTDPAAHMSMTVESTFPNLMVSRIDPQVERDRYRQHVMETKGQNLDEAGRTLLEEDLRSPCTEEIAVFQAFSRVMRESREKFVVVDTAPTGHTLLLLDATGSYHRDVVRHLQPGAHVVTPMMRLQDPKQTKMLVVTLPETTPVLEAESLQADLRRAGIEPWAWVINSSLSAASPSDPLLVERAAEERPHIERVRQSVSRVAIIPWLTQEPTGSKRLLELTRSNPVSTELQATVKERFAKVAQAPDQEKKFPVGPASAKKLGYDPIEIDALPTSVTESFCGVGNPLGLGELRVGQIVLELGSGPGMDSLLAARRVEPTGKVVGVDMCEEMIAKARHNAKLLNLNNVEFVNAGIEKLPLPDESVDLVISNGVFNLCPDKPRVLVEAFRVLRPGGRLQMADILLEEGVTSEEVAKKGSWSD